MQTILRLQNVVLGILLFLFSSSLKAGEDYEKAIDHWCDSILANTKLPGMIVGVWAPGKVEYVKAKGKSDIANGTAMDLSYKFRIGSVTKTFVVTVLLQLVDEGKVKIDDSISKYFPDYPNGTNITVRMLANMTSGIYNFTESAAFDDSITNHPNKKWTPEEELYFAVQNKPDFEPGNGWHYSNSNYILLGEIIEKITGITIENEINNRIIIPLGLKNTTFPHDGFGIPEPFSRGYMTDSTGKLLDYTEYADISWAWAAGAMISDLEDMKIWAEALVTGKMISPESQKERLKWVNVANTPAKYGLGIFTIQGFTGHDGGLPGYTNYTMYDPIHKATIIVFYNTQDDKIKPGSLFRKIAELLYPESK